MMAEFAAVPVGSRVLSALAAHLLARWPQPLELAQVGVWLPTQAAAQRLRALLAARGCRLFPAMRTYAWDETRDGPLPGRAAAPSSVERLAWHAAVRDVSARLGLPLPPSALAGQQARGVQAMAARLIDYGIPPDMVATAVPERLLLHWRLTADLVQGAWAEAARALAEQELDLFAAARARGRQELSRRVGTARGPQIAVGLVDAVPGQAAILDALAARADATVFFAGTPDEQPLVARLAERLGATSLSIPDIPAPAPDIAMAEADGIMDEIRTISRAVRHALAGGALRIGIVCPDAGLLDRAFTALRADGVAASRIEGLPLTSTRAGQLAARILRVAATTATQPFSGEAPLALAALGGHLSVRDAVPAINWAALERDVWRGVVIRSWDDAATKAEQAGLGDSVAPLAEIFQGIGRAAPASRWKTWLEGAMDTLAPGWRDDWGAGECLLWLAEWAAADTRLDALELAAWAGQDLDARPVPVPAPTDGGQVFLWAPKDALLQDCDLLILAGLNEGCWPHAGDIPLLSAAMLERLGLPGPASRDALAMHDWTHLLAAAPRLLLSRARMHGDEETVPSRFWQQAFSAPRAAAGEPFLPPDDTAEAPAAHAPMGTWPALESLWPKTWSASWIRAVMDCPYKAVGERLMGLDESDPFGAMPDKATSGTLVHAWVEAFWRHKPGWPAPWDAPLTQANRTAAETRFAEIAQYGLRHEPRLVQRLWAPRVPRLAAALVGEWIKDAATGRHPEMLEAWLTLAPEGDIGATIGAQADRIDRTGAGFVIVDYKTGQPPTWEAVAAGRQPQLPLEAWILAAQESSAGIPVAAVEYWQLRGYGAQPLRRTGRDAAKLSGWVDDTRNGVSRLLDVLGPTAGFPATPEPEGACKHCVLAGVCRRREAAV